MSTALLQARSVLDTLLGCDWFIALPGPARKLVIDHAMQHLCQALVWGFVNPSVWDRRWEAALGPDLHEAASNVAQKLDYVPMSAAIQPSPQYQFRVAQGEHCARQEPLHRADCSVVAAVLTLVILLLIVIVIVVLLRVQQQVLRCWDELICFLARKENG